MFYTCPVILGGNCDILFICKKGGVNMSTNRKKYPRGDWSPRRKESQNNWMKENRYKPSTNIPKDIGEQFKEYCNQKGKTVSAVLAEFIYACVAEMNDKP